MTTNPDGVILIEDLGTNSVKRKLVYGQDFYRYNLDINLSERYSKYIVKGKNSKTHTQVFGEALDSVPNDGSVLVINKTNISAEDAQNTARFQAALRASQSFSASITINGFKDVFQLNDTVYLDIPQRGVRSEMLVNDFTYDFASNSLNLGFVLPDVYKLIPEITSGGIEI
jgi:aspartate 1-decarboxylase